MGNRASRAENGPRRWGRRGRDDDEEIIRPSFRPTPQPRPIFVSPPTTGSVDGLCVLRKIINQPDSDISGRKMDNIVKQCTKHTQMEEEDIDFIGEEELDFGEGEAVEQVMEEVPEEEMIEGFGNLTQDNTIFWLIVIVILFFVYLYYEQQKNKF